MTAPEPIPPPRKKRIAPLVEPPVKVVVTKDTYKGDRTPKGKPELAPFLGGNSPKQVTPLAKRLAARVGTEAKPLDLPWPPRVLPRHRAGPKLVPSTPTEIVEPITVGPDGLQDSLHFAERTVITQPISTREGWLLAAIEHLKPTFETAGHPVPPVRVSIGWPGGRGKKTGVIGQCWFGATVDDGIPALFISPALKDPAIIVACLIHEMTHAALGITGHRQNFARIAAKVGLVAPWTAVEASEPLKGDIAKLIEVLGPFPHAGVNGGAGLLGDRPKVQTTRMLKLECPEDGYTVRTTHKWIEVGLPSCPDGHELVPA